MAFATLIIKTNIGEVTATPLWYISRYILRLDKKTFAVFILSQIGGYPVGVRLLSELYADRITAVTQSIYATATTADLPLLRV